MKIYELCLSIVENFNATKGKKKKNILPSFVYKK